MSLRAHVNLAGAAALVFLVLAWFQSGCVSVRVSPPPSVAPVEYTVITTGYCPCSECCGWKRNWYGRPVFASGPLKGKPKVVGQTASGTMAKPGTIAADTTIFPFGTIIYVPSYGYGRVEDRGGDIKGYRLDLFYRSHSAAKQQGRQKERIKVWFPPGDPRARPMRTEK